MEHGSYTTVTIDYCAMTSTSDADKVSGKEQRGDSRDADMDATRA